MQRTIYWYWLSRVQGLDYHRIQLLLSCFEDVEAIYKEKKETIQKAGSFLNISEAVLHRLITTRESESLQQEFNQLEEQNIRFVTKEEPDYPKRLLPLEDAPFWLFYSGKLPSDEVPSLAVIGARNCSNYGKEIASCFSKVLAGSGVQIISGMARGIDGHAHTGALAGKGYTCAVLGFGLDICYPQEHYLLKEQIHKTGGLVSEYPLQTPGCRLHFPARNRLISGLSDGVLVVEAAKKSGTLITVDSALAQGRNVYVVPGRISDVLSTGCNELMKSGAKPVTGPADILEDFQLVFGQSMKRVQKKKRKFLLETEEKIVYACLDLYPKHIEELMKLTDFPLDKLTQLLFEMERKEYINQPLKNHYAVMFQG